jgi:hypothetical protein
MLKYIRGIKIRYPGRTLKPVFPASNTESASKEFPKLILLKYNTVQMFKALDISLFIVFSAADEMKHDARDRQRMMPYKD